MARGLTLPARRDRRADGSSTPGAPGPGGEPPAARGRGTSAARPGALAALVPACLGLAALSLLLPSTPTYDPWAWILWGREIAHLDLETVDGPSWKPLPVLFTTAFAPAGAAAPALWLVLARAGALLAVAIAYRLAHRLAGPLAGVVAALGVALSAGWARNAALGNSEGLLVALGLLAVERHLDGRRDHAILLGLGAALLRPEAWPFLGLYAAWLWFAERPRRRLVVTVLALVPLLWFGPELWGSGDPFRAASRAQDPTSLSPAYSDRPALEILRLAALLVMASIWAGALAAIGFAARDLRRRRGGLTVVVLAGGAIAWVALVAVMTQAGYAGNQRYLVLPAAAAAVVGAVGLVWLARAAVGAVLRGAGDPARARGPRWGTAHRARGAAVLVLVAAAVAPFAVAPAARLDSELDLVGEEARLNRDLAAAVRAGGGRGAILRCGRPYTGPYQVPALAWLLRVHVGRIGLEPLPPGVVFRKRAAASRFGLPRPGHGFRRVARAGAFDVLAACRASARRRGASAEGAVGSRPPQGR